MSEKIKLGDYVSIKTGKLDANASKTNGQYPFFTCSIQPLRIDNYSYDCECVLVAGNGDLNVKYYNGKFDAYQRTYIIESINKRVINNRYLYYLINSKIEHLRNNSIGGVIKYIKLGNLTNIEFNKIDIQKQEECVNLLDKMQEIIDIRKTQIEKLDELIKSQFVEMFENVKETVRLGDCCDVHARIGWQALTQSEHMQNGDYMLITGTDFRNNEIDYSTCVYVSKERYEMDKNIILKNDDILITKDGTIGKVAIVHNLIKPATLNGGVFVVRPKEIFNKEYIAYVFKGPLFTDFVNKSKTGATIKHLNQKHLVEFEIPIPTLEEQIRFSNIYKQVDKQKFKIQKSLEEIQLIEASLINKYFGE